MSVSNVPIAKRSFSVVVVFFGHPMLTDKPFPPRHAIDIVGFDFQNICQK